MFSSSSSSSPPLTPSQIIDQILNTKMDDPDVDLHGLVLTIDNLLDHYSNKQEKRSPIRENVALLECVPSASKASNFSEAVSKNVKIIAAQISESSKDNHQQTIAVLNAIGNVHWVGVGFLLVAAVLEKMDTIQNNKMECLRLLKSMNDLAKVIRQLQCLPHLKNELQIKMKESINLAVEGAISCCSQKRRTKIGRLFKASKDARHLQELGKRVDEMREQLHLQISASTFEVVQRTVVCNQPPIPDPSNAAVGIEQQIAEVIRQLDWENDNPALAVVVHGVGGCGKTTLADAVYASLKGRLQGWKHSKITLIQNLEKEPEIGKLQSQILQDLTGMKQEDIRDSGGQRLKDIIEKEPIFLYIDNALYQKPLKKLLPKEVANPKKLRLLLTARKTNVCGIIEDCILKPCKIYPMEPIPVDAALKILCRKIDRERETNSILTETPLVNEIAKKCICCPLFLELVGGYLHKRKNKAEACRRVMDYLEWGEPFSCDKEEDSFEESGILFAYEALQPSAQDAFLDICSFFYDSWRWNWETVSCIVGEEEMECLQEGALLKRKEDWISIHDLILAAGRKKSKHNRFKYAHDFSVALENEKIIISQIKGVWLKDTICDVPAEVLDTMGGSLRVFAMGNWTSVKGECSKQFEELRFLQVGEVPNLPIEIPKLKHLTYLDYEFKNDMNLSSCQDLRNLKVLKFSKCDGSHLLGLSEWTHLNKLKELVLRGCNTTEIPQSFAKLQNLHKFSLLESPDLEELPKSLGKLRSLQHLDLSNCRHLKRLTPKIGELGALTRLYLQGCTSLKELPIELENLSSLKLLNLGCCVSLEELPLGLENLSSLHTLVLLN